MTSEEAIYAYAPAHVSGLFAIHDGAKDPLQRGSRGAGWCIDQGAHARVARAHDEVTTIRLEGEAASEAVVTRDALHRLDPDARLDVTLRLGLPAGQGFGMSAAGTLAACLAASRLLELEPERALEATHAAEIEHATGLGDAIGSWFGGGELRIKPGCPPHGWAMQIHPPDDGAFLFCVLGDPLSTAGVIRDPTWKQRTKRLGDAAVDRILDVGRERAWATLLKESKAFGQTLGLMPTKLDMIGRQLPEDVQWGQCMLGSTMWVYGGRGDLERAEARLEGHGALIHARVDPNGARIVRGMPEPAPAVDA